MHSNAIILLYVYNYNGPLINNESSLTLIMMICKSLQQHDVYSTASCQW